MDKFKIIGRPTSIQIHNSMWRQSYCMHRSSLNNQIVTQRTKDRQRVFIDKCLCGIVNVHWPESNRQLWISWSAASNEPADKRWNGTHGEATIRQHCQTSPTVNTTWTRPQKKKKTAKGHLEKWSKVNKKLCYCKKIASHHSCYKISRPVHGRRHLKISSYLVWSPCKIWLLFIIPRGNMYSS